MTDKKTVALVTGASRGIGKACLHELGKSGMTVIGTSTTREGALAITQSLKDLGLSGRGIEFNVQNFDSIPALIKDISENEGSIDVLVNNAGIARGSLLIRMSDQDWDNVMVTNLTSIFRLSKAVIGAMIKTRYGRIINISAAVAALGHAGQTNYGASKAGIIGFSKSLAREVATRGITVNCVAPGLIDTDLTKSMSDLERESTLKNIPLSRAGTPEDVAAAVLFLASPAAEYITGQTIHVNGGLFMSD
jgi:3-oxoacyl-[acyl-carrier protein] reductase